MPKNASFPRWRVLTDTLHNPVLSRGCTPCLHTIALPYMSPFWAVAARPVHILLPCHTLLHSVRLFHTPTSYRTPRAVPRTPPFSRNSGALCHPSAPSSSFTNLAPHSHTLPQLPVTHALHYTPCHTRPAPNSLSHTLCHSSPDTYALPNTHCLAP